jgi:hypothetical protein
MKHVFICVALTIAAIGPVGAQVLPPGTVQASPPATYPGPVQRYPFSAATPRDAYRQGLINRFELEQYEGPTPQALQGPSVDGGRGGAATGGS